MVEVMVTTGTVYKVDMDYDRLCRQVLCPNKVLDRIVSVDGWEIVPSHTVTFRKSKFI